jgi:two-component SAPR family response regulator
MEQDLVFLDEEMFQVDSVAFNRQAADILKSGEAANRGPELLSLYRGRFAPEFEYEEWAESWRTALHGTYLHLAHRTATELGRSGRLWEATEVLTPVVSIDPLAFDLRATLIGYLAAVGSVDAAMAHYKNYADLHVRDLGVPALSYDQIVRGVSDRQT